jgi:hypothetical protein
VPPLPPVGRERRFLVGLIAATLALGIAITWPLARHPLDTAPATTFTMGHLVGIGFAARKLLDLDLDPHLPLAAWPGGADFRPLLWPVNLLAVLTGPVLAFNALVVATPSINALCTWWLGGKLGMGAWSRLGFAGVVAWNPWVSASLQNGQVEQALLGGVSLVLGCLVAGATGATWLAGMAGVVSLGVAMATPHVGLAAVLVSGAWAAWEFARTRRWRWLLIAATIALGAWLAARWHAVNFDDGNVHLFAPLGSRTEAGLPARKSAVLLRDLFTRAQMPPEGRTSVLHSGYLGIPLLVLAAMGGRRQPPALFAGLVMAVLSLGRAGGLWSVLTGLSPTLALSDTPYRCLIGGWVALAAAAARYPSRLVVFWPLFCWLETAWVDPRPLPMATIGVATQGPTRALALRTGPVLYLRYSARGCGEAIAGDLLEATRHGRPVPWVLRDGPSALPTGLALPARVEAALSSAQCAHDLEELSHGWPFAAVVARKTGRCKVTLAQAACISRVFGSAQEDARYWWWDGLAK